VNRANRTRPAVGDQHRHAIRGPHDERHIRPARDKRIRIGPLHRQLLANNNNLTAVNLIERHNVTDRHADGNGKRLPRNGRG
jgi:hypothetical protein